MISNLSFALTFFAALGSAVMAGVFFAFSNFIMKALARIPTPAGIGAMQDINVTVINPLFMLFFLGTALVSLVLAVHTAMKPELDGAVYCLSGAVVYLVGAFFITMVFNVPRNNALAKAEPLTEGGARVWKSYLSRWTFWNHVRTVASFAAAALFMIALTR